MEFIEETAGLDGPREYPDSHRPRYSETSSERLVSGNADTFLPQNYKKKS